MSADVSPPLTPKQASEMLNVSVKSVYRMCGLEWVEYQATGLRPIRRITLDSVRRLLERKRGAA
jgi:hypothetical protein